MRSESPSKKRASGEEESEAQGASSRWTVLASAMAVMVSMACWARSRREQRRIWSGAAGLHALEVEDVVDEADEAVGVGDGDAEEVLGFGVDVADDAGGEKTECAANAGEWGAKFVRDGGDEFVLQRVQLGALTELDAVLMLLLSCLRELLGEIAYGALSTQEREEKNAGGGEQR